MSRAACRPLAGAHSHSPAVWHGPATARRTVETYRLRKLTKDGDDNAIIYVDQGLMNVLKWQKERQDAERERLGDLWVDHDPCVRP